MQINARVLHDIEQCPLITPLLPILLPCEVLVLLWQEWTFYRYDIDRSWMEDGDFWSTRLYGTQAQEPVAWGAASLVLAALYEYSLLWSGLYLAEAFGVMLFRDYITENIRILRVMKAHWWT